MPRLSKVEPSCFICGDPASDHDEDGCHYWFTSGDDEWPCDCKKWEER